MSDIITIIESHKPSVVCKKYTLQPDGTLKKTVIASITEGVGASKAVPDAYSLVSVLRDVTESTNLVLCTGEWRNAADRPFAIIPEETLARLMQSRVGEVAGGVIDKEGYLVSARLKRGIEPSCLILLDADNPPGMPPEWAELHISERLLFWEAMLPGIGACERIELRGSSARVRKEGEPSKPATHAFIRVSDASKICLMKAYLAVEMVNRGLSFPFEKLSRSSKMPGKVVGIEHRGLFDLAVFDTGRLIFCARPDVSEAPGYIVDDAGITIVNEGGGALDLAFLTTPDQHALERYRKNTGITLEINATPHGGGLSVVSSGQLKQSTEITRKGVSKPLSAWIADMKPGDKLRCEAPFRESYSEAAFIRITPNGEPFVHDVGNGVTYRLANRFFDGGLPQYDGDLGSSQNAPAAATVHGPSPGPTILLAPGSTLTPEPIHWLWGGWLAIGKLHLLAGAPGSGKTTIAIALAAAITAGGKWPDGTPATAGNVVIWSGEDGVSDTLLPRLLACDGDAARVHFVIGASNGSASGPFDPAHHMQALEKAVRDLRPKFLILDPVVSAVAADTHKSGEVRRGLQPVVDLAERLGCAVLGITHLAKNTAGRDPLERVSGSIAFGAIARVVLATVKAADPDAPRRLVRAKSNIGPDTGGFEYSLSHAPVPGYDFENQIVTWGRTLEGSARDLMAAEEPKSDDDKAAVSFLLELLADGPVPTKAVREAASQHEIGFRSVERAKQELGVRAVKLGMKQGWAWMLPTKVLPTEGGPDSAELLISRMAARMKPSDGEEP